MMMAALTYNLKKYLELFPKSSPQCPNHEPSKRETSSSGRTAAQPGSELWFKPFRNFKNSWVGKIKPLLNRFKRGWFYKIRKPIQKN